MMTINLKIGINCRKGGSLFWRCIMKNKVKVNAMYVWNEFAAIVVIIVCYTIALINTYRKQI
jgi:hypothetical protein